MRIILVDDEKPALEELTYIINKYSFIELIGTYNNPTIALERILKEKPDVVFLDVEMSEINGFTIAREIIRAEMDTIIVFVTAFDEYAIKAFEVNAVDYILKSEALDTEIIELIDDVCKKIQVEKKISDQI